MNSSDPVTSQPEVNKGDNYGATDIHTLPMGLKVMNQVSEVRVQQHIDPAEVVLSCCNRPCRYSVYPGVDDEDDQFLYITEVSDCYARQLLGSSRGFSLKVIDMDQVDVIRLFRPQICARGCCGFCVCCDLPTLGVQTPPGTTVGYITEKRTCCRPVYRIYDSNDVVLYNVVIRGCCSTTFSFLRDIRVDIQEVMSDMTVARLTKQTRCNTGECVGSQNNFTITYLTDLTWQHKVIILGAMFLIDFHYFERQNRCCC